MTTRRTINWFLALLIAAIMAASHLLDGPTEPDALRDVAADLHQLTTPQGAL